MKKERKETQENSKYRKKKKQQQRKRRGQGVAAENDIFFLMTRSEMCVYKEKKMVRAPKLTVNLSPSLF